MAIGRLPAGGLPPALPPVVPWRRFAVIGDTFSALLKSARPGRPRRSWADQVSAALSSRQPDLAYLNLSRQNLVSSQARSRQLPRMLAFSPDLAALSFGYDDALSDSFDIGHFESELVRIMMALRNADCTVLVTGIFDISGRATPPARRRQLRQQIDMVNVRTAAIALRFGGLYADLPATVGANGAEYSSDGGLNHRGHAIAASQVIRLLDSYLSGPLR